MIGWTYGVEHEWADWPMLSVLPRGYKRDDRDVTIVNSNGIANDPSGRDYAFGGEINTPPTDSMEGQVGCLEELKALYPEATVNYRSNLHLHIRVPGLKDDLKMLKRVQAHIHRWMPSLLREIEPELFAKPVQLPGETDEEHAGHLRRWRRRRVSHTTLLTGRRVMYQLEAQTVAQFFEREVPRSKAGAVMWHAQPRLCVNLRQLRETNTVEFRHFPGTLDAGGLLNAFLFCKDYLRRAMDGEGCEYHEQCVRGVIWPFPRYNHWQEERYRATVCDGTVDRETRQRNIAAILAGTFLP